MLGIGIIGAGRICSAHATAARALPETELVGIAEVEPDRLKQACDAYGCRGYAEYRELLEDSRVEAVVIALPHWLHRDVTLAALEAGKHVLLEKPMAMTLAECDAMVDAAEASGKTLMVAHSQHFFPVNAAVRQLVAAGGIGSLVMATDTWYKPFYDGVRPAWFLDDRQGGGMWAMNGSHMIDRLMFFVGSPVTAVKARIGNPIHGVSTDSGTAYLDFASGVTAVIAHAGYKDGVNRFECEMTGTEAQVRLTGDNNGGPEYWLSRGGRWEACPVSAPQIEYRSGQEPRNPVFAYQMREFAIGIREGRPPAITPEYARDVVRVLDACEESSRTGREVRLD